MYKRLIVDKTTRVLWLLVWQIKDILNPRGESDMDEFFVEKSANENGEHIVHKECCPSLPVKDELRWIGVRSTIAVPLKEAADFFSKSAPCSECMAN